jgi:surface adhesion protein
VLTLSNGKTITIEVGQTTGSVDYTVRADDPYVQGTLALAPVSITSTAGGNFEDVAKTGTVLTSVTDDADTTTVTLSSAADGEDGRGRHDDHVHGAGGQRGDGSDLVLTLSNGKTITIEVGQTTGSVDYTVRADDPYVQGTLALAPVSITSTAGGNFEDVAKTGTVLTSVTDDADTTTVTLSSAADGETVEEGTTITYTAQVDNAVTGSDLVLTLSNGKTITIEVGQTTGSVDYTVRADDPYVQGTLALAPVSITSTAGGNFEDVAKTGTVLTSVTDDADTTTVTLSSAADGETVEEGTTITYTAQVDNAVTGSDLVLTLSNGKTITIEVGQTTGSVDYTVRADDPYVQGTLALAPVSITSTAGGNFEDVAKTGTVLTSVTDDADTTTVTLSSAADGETVEEGTTITYTAQVDNAVTGSDLVLTLSNGKTITIEVGQTTGSVDYTVRADDPYVQGTLALAPVSITSTAGGNFEDVAKTGTVLTSVTDDADTTTVTLSSAADGETVEEGTTITYTAQVDNAVTGSDLVLTLSNGKTITIEVGQTTGSVDYTVRADDPYVQGTLALAPVSITSTAGGNFEDVAKTGTVLTSVTDDADTTTVTLSSAADGETVEEGTTITYTAQVDNAVTGSDLVLTLSNGKTITIEVGQTTGSVDYTVRADDPYVQGTLALAPVSITSTAGGNFEDVAKTGTVLTSVTDDADTTTVTLSSAADGETVEEGTTITYTAQVDNAVTGSDLVLTLSNGKTITIEVGQTTGSVDYTVRADDPYVQGTLALAPVSITSTAGGNFEDVAKTGTVLTSVTDDADTTTVTLSSAADGETVEEGTTITYTAQVDNAVTGSDLVLTLSNGKTITIEVGQTTGSVDYTVRADDRTCRARSRSRRCRSRARRAATSRMWRRRARC